MLQDGLGRRYVIRIYIGFALVISTFVATMIAVFGGCRPFDKYWQINPNPGSTSRPSIINPPELTNDFSFLSSRHLQAHRMGVVRRKRLDRYIPHRHPSSHAVGIQLEDDQEDRFHFHPWCRYLCPCLRHSEECLRPGGKSTCWPSNLTSLTLETRTLFMEHSLPEHGAHEKLLSPSSRPTFLFSSLFSGYGSLRFSEVYYGRPRRRTKHHQASVPSVAAAVEAEAKAVVVLQLRTPSQPISLSMIARSAS